MRLLTFKVAILFRSESESLSKSVGNTSSADEKEVQPTTTFYNNMLGNVNRLLQGSNGSLNHSDDDSPIRRKSSSGKTLNHKGTAMLLCCSLLLLVFFGTHMFVIISIACFRKTNRRTAGSKCGPASKKYAISIFGFQCNDFE